MSDIDNHKAHIDRQLNVEIGQLVLQIQSGQTATEPSALVQQLSDGLRQLLLARGFDPHRQSTDTLLSFLQDLLPQDAQTQASQSGDAPLSEDQRQLAQMLGQQAEAGPASEQEQALLERIQAQPLGTLADYLSGHYAYWRLHNPEINEHFVRLSLWLRDDQQKTQADAHYPSLEALMAEQLAKGMAGPKAFILLGHPGNGKSTLLRHLSQHLCGQHLQALAALAAREPGEGTAPPPGSTAPPIALYVELNQYPPDKIRPDAPDPSPMEWLNQQWQQQFDGGRPPLALSE